MPEIFAEDAASYNCPFNDFKPCFGEACMAFVWSGRPHDNCETDNLVDTAEGIRPLGDPQMPEGDGWVMDGPSFSKGYHRSEKDKLPKATGQRWVRPRPLTRGSCGRIQGNGYGW